MKITTSPKRFFTLVEITMAIAIIGIGMAGVMALLPIGFNATRDAMSDNYSADMADQFLHLIAQQSKKDWATWVVNNTKVPQEASRPTEADLNTAVTGSELIPGINILETNKPGVFYVEAKSGNIKDFSAHMAVWKSPVTVAAFEGTWQPWTATSDQATGLNVEISWPTEKPYAQREKKYYYLEIFKPL